MALPTAVVTPIPRTPSGAAVSVFFLALSLAFPVFAGASGTWTATGTLNFPRVGHSATLLANGQVLVAGGEDTSGNLIVRAELYNRPLASGPSLAA
jgi:hypothetical protein